jgi:hypothetical protein
MHILPAFTQFPKEAAIIGRLLAGYGELEFNLCQCLATLSGDVATAVRVLFRVRGEAARIKIADALMRPKYEKAGLKDAYDETLIGMDWCRLLRNQFAHCHWEPTKDGGLGFALLEKGAQGNKEEIQIPFRLITEALLKEQEAHFCYVQRCLSYLSRDYQRRANAHAVHDFPPPNGKAPPVAYIGEEREATRAKKKPRRSGAER